MAITRPRPGLLAGEPLLLMAALVLTLYFAREVLIPFALALTLSFLLTPGVTLLERMKFRRVPAVSLVVVMAATLVGSLGWVVVMQLVGVAEELPRYQQNIHAKIATIHVPAGGALNRTIGTFEEIDRELVHGATSSFEVPAKGKRRVVEAMPVSMVPAQESAVDYLRRMAVPFIEPLGLIGMVVIFTLYILVKREDLRNRLLLVAGMGRINIMTQALNDAATRISSYLLSQLLVNSSYGLLFGMGLFMLGVPHATLWGVLSCIFRFIPYIGALAAMAMPLTLALAISHTWWLPVMVFALYAVLETVTGNFVEPWLYGTRTGVSSLALLVMAILWVLLWGWAGLVLSTPLTVCLIVMGRYMPQLSFLHTLLGDEAELAPEAQFYQRLLAMDQLEAHVIADKFLQGRDMVQLYDELLLPALSLAEHDRHKGNLDEARLNFLMLSTSELMAELTDYHPGGASLLQGGNEPAAGNNGSRSAPVVCFAASDEADELAATMLAQLLERAGHNTLLLPPSSISDEILERLAQAPDTIVCISALPPFAFADARATSMRVRQHLKRHRLIVGMWGANGDTEKIRERFGAAQPNVVVTSLRQAMERVQTWQSEVQPVAGQPQTVVPLRSGLA